MRSTLMITVLVLATAASCLAENVVRNPDFAQASAQSELVPAEWELPEGELWRRAEVGPEGEIGLLYEAEASVCGPVRQRIEGLELGATWDLRVDLKASGGMLPLLALRDADGEGILRLGLANVGSRWQTAGLRWTATKADVIVEIYADQRQFEDKESGGGTVRVARVELVRVDLGVDHSAADLGENVALGKPYTMTPPSYGPTIDPGDNVQLTDGIYAEDRTWIFPETVGWRMAGAQFVKMDLGENLPIKGVAFRTSAGSAGVVWPKRILISVSDDGETWYPAGDLVKLSNQREPLPPFGAYSARQIWTDQLHTHGRYLGLVIEADGPYTFCDEVEVYRGDAAWLAELHEGETAPEPERYVTDLLPSELVKQQLLLDLETVREDIAEVAGGARGLMQSAQNLAEAVEGMRPIQMDGFRAVLPMNELEADIFRLQAEVWRVQDKPALRVWHQHRWDPLAPSAEPVDDAAPAMSVQMMSNEYRADVLNLTNATEDVMQVTLSVTGLPEGADEFLALHKVEHVGTRHFTSVASALPEAERQGDGWVVDVPAGMTRQVWLAVNRPDLPAGEYSGAVQVSGQGFAPVSVPLDLRIWPLRMPDGMTLMVGGWSDTDRNSYGLTDENRDAVIEHLMQYQVNAPWATPAAMPQGSYDEAGAMTEEPSTEKFDAWVANWPDRKMYLVFLGVNVNMKFGDADHGTERFNVALGNWTRFWADHMRELGLEPSQLAILSLDEPRQQDHYDTVTDWSKAIKAAGTGIRMWSDPVPPGPEGLEDMYAVTDIFCPNRRLNVQRPAWYLDQMVAQQAAGKELWLYSCSGPARSFDPYAYYLAQAWDAFRLNAKASCFWCFTDTGGVSCWNEYPAGGNGPYCPSYIDDTSVTTSKYMEAIREGSQDYEYLTMLAARLAELEAAGAPAAGLAKARELLATGVQRVLASDDASNYRWDEARDRAEQDRVRVEVMQALVDMQ